MAITVDMLLGLPTSVLMLVAILFAIACVAVVSEYRREKKDAEIRRAFADTEFMK